MRFVKADEQWQRLVYEFFEDARARRSEPLLLDSLEVEDADGQVWQLDGVKLWEFPSRGPVLDWEYPSREEPGPTLTVGRYGGAWAIVRRRRGYARALMRSLRNEQRVRRHGRPRGR